VHQNSIGWGVFGVVIAAALAADLFFSRRSPEAVKAKRALAETLGWIGLALAFGIGIYISRGRQAGAEFFTAYALEKSLSADNILVFVLIFRAFGIDPRYQHRILYTGILGALVMRLAFVLAGVQILDHFHFALYVFGLALVLLGVHMLISPGPFQPEQNWLIRIVHRIHPVDSAYRGPRFWVRSADHLAVTPVLLALVAIEAMDLIFALDSVPAVLAITRDVFIAYSSNVFAILGLRAMYFGLADLMSRMRFLHQGLAGILLFVGAKMLFSEWVVIPTFISLAVILGALAVTAFAAWLLPDQR
jgi:tellurite resistance protein TerC